MHNYICMRFGGVHMKHIIPSKLRQMMSSVMNAVSSGIRRYIPARFRKWLLPAVILLLVIGISCSFIGKEPAGEPFLCTVSVNNLNVHKIHDPDSSVVGLLPEGLEITILEQISANDENWGRIEKMKLPDGKKVKGGWINLEYVRLPGQPDPEATVPSTETPTEPEPDNVILPYPNLGSTVMGTVTAGKLNIRKGADSKYEAFDAYYKGDRIEIQEIVHVDDTDWGYTGKGWVGMGYVRLDGIAPSSEEQPADGNQMNSNGSYKILGYGVVDLGELNVRLGPDTQFDKVGTVLEGTKYAIYEVEGDWVRIDGGWVTSEFFYIEGTTASDAANGTVLVDNLNVRTGPGTTFKSLSTLNKGDTVKILGQVGDWGYTSAGWVNVTNMELSAPDYTTGSGKVTSGLNIRKEPNAEFEAVGTYSEGDPVTIIEVQGSWGKTELGWINLKYVDFD